MDACSQSACNTFALQSSLGRKDPRSELKLNASNVQSDLSEKEREAGGSCSKQLHGEPDSA